jgi:hypothetical protein
VSEFDETSAAKMVRLAEAYLRKVRKYGAEPPKDCKWANTPPVARCSAKYESKWRGIESDSEIGLCQCADEYPSVDRDWLPLDANGLVPRHTYAGWRYWTYVDGVFAHFGTAEDSV